MTTLIEVELFETQPLDIWDFPAYEGQVDTVTKIIYADTIAINSKTDLNLGVAQHLIIFSNKLIINSKLVIEATSLPFPRIAVEYEESPPYIHIQNFYEAVQFKKASANGWWNFGNIIISSRMIEFGVDDTGDVGDLSILTGVYYMQSNQLRGENGVVSDFSFDCSPLPAYTLLACDKLAFKNQAVRRTLVEATAIRIIFELTEFLYSIGQISDKSIDRSQFPATMRVSDKLVWKCKSISNEMKNFMFNHYILKIFVSSTDNWERKIMPDFNISFEQYYETLKEILVAEFTELEDAKISYLLMLGPGSSSYNNTNRAFWRFYSDTEVAKYHPKKIPNTKLINCGFPVLFNSDFTEFIASSDYSRFCLDKNDYLRCVSYDCFSNRDFSISYYYSKWVVLYLENIASRYLESKGNPDADQKEMFQVHETLRTLKEHYEVVPEFSQRYLDIRRTLTAIRMEIVNLFVDRDIIIKGSSGDEISVKVYSYLNPGLYFALPNIFIIKPIKINSNRYWSWITFDTDDNFLYLGFSGLIIVDHFSAMRISEALNEENLSLVDRPDSVVSKVLGFNSSNAALLQGIDKGKSSIDLHGETLSGKLCIINSMSSFVLRNIFDGNLAIQIEFAPRGLEEMSIPVNVALNMGKFGIEFGSLVSNNNLKNITDSFNIHVGYVGCKDKVVNVGKVIEPGKSITIECSESISLFDDGLTYIPVEQSVAFDTIYKFRENDRPVLRIVTIENLIRSSDPIYDRDILHGKIEVTIDNQLVFEGLISPAGITYDKILIRYINYGENFSQLLIVGEFIYYDGSVKELVPIYREIKNLDLISITFSDLHQS